MSQKYIYALPRTITDVDDCYFYHTMEVPGYGLMHGQWDLRKTWHEYLGRVSFKDKRVLEIGTADGFICFNLENQGADVVAYDLSENDAWDLVPFVKYNYKKSEEPRRAHIRKLNNAFWLCHRVFQSKAKMVYGTTYGIPSEIGAVDISIFGSVLLHLRDPFAALQSALNLTKETVIIAEPIFKGRNLRSRILSFLKMPTMEFLPKFTTGKPNDTWWTLSPAAITAFVGVLGFEKTHITYHVQQYGEWGGFSRVPYYTIVGHRTTGGNITIE